MNTTREWYECRDCVAEAQVADWPEGPPFCGECAADNGRDVRMVRRVDHENFEPPTVRGEVI